MEKLLLLVAIASVSIAVHYTSTVKQTLAEHSCYEYLPIASFRQAINTEIEAGDIATGYFQGLGLNVPSEAITITKTETGWLATLNPRWAVGVQLCVKGLEPPACVGRSLLLEAKTRTWNQALMEYEVECPKTELAN